MKVQYLLNNLTISEDIQKEIKTDLQGTKNIVFIASDFNNATKNDQEFRNQLMWLHNIGLDYPNAYLVDERIGEYTATELIKEADVVFLNDGNPVNQMLSINRYGIKEEILETRAVIGLGYGACNLARDVKLSKCEERGIDEHINYHGIGLNNINLEPHFDFMNLNHNSKELFPRSIMNEVLCMEKDSAAKITDTVTYFNKFHLLRDGKLEEIKTRTK